MSETEEFSFEYTGTYLNQFPHDRRAPITNDFCYAARGGADTVENVLIAVAVKTRSRLDELDEQGCDEKKEALLYKLLDSLKTEEAARFAAHILRREAMAPEERERLKAERNAKFRRDHLMSLPPTSKQVGYLKVLGVTEVPNSRFEATRMIEAALAAKGVPNAQQDS